MKKQKVQFLILIIVLVVLIVGYFGIQRYNEYLANQPEEEPAEMVIDMDSSEVMEITYTYDGETYSFVKEDDVWKNKEDTSLSIIQSRLENMATKITQIEAIGIIENVSDMSEYGLDEPSRTISFSTADVSCEVKVGDYNTMSAVYYISVDDGTTVYAMGTSTVLAFNYTLDDLIEEEVTEETAEEAVEEVAEETAEEIVEG